MLKSLDIHEKKITFLAKKNQKKKPFIASLKKKKFFVLFSGFHFSF